VSILKSGGEAFFLRWGRKTPPAEKETSTSGAGGCDPNRGKEREQRRRACTTVWQEQRRGGRCRRHPAREKGIRQPTRGRESHRKGKEGTCFSCLYDEGASTCQEGRNKCLSLHTTPKMFFHVVRGGGGVVRGGEEKKGSSSHLVQREKRPVASKAPRMLQKKGRGGKEIKRSMIRQEKSRYECNCQKSVDLLRAKKKKEKRKGLRYYF